MRRHLVLFVRAPQLGTGKRRLARDIGDTAAVRFERLMFSLLLRRLGPDKRWQLRIAVTPDKARRHLRYWHGQIESTGQGRGDLGIRMRCALRACPPGPVVLVGADIPALSARHIAAAFRLLGSRDLVFGPAEDGGFWLVGARHPRQLPHLFERVRWSGPHALADTLAGLPRRLTVGFAERLEDVDDGEAYRRHAATRLNPAFPADAIGQPATAGSWRSCAVSRSKSTGLVMNSKAPSSRARRLRSSSP